MKSVLGIIGLGNMGSAIARGLAAREDITVDDQKVILTNTSGKLPTRRDIVGFGHNEDTMKTLENEGCLTALPSALDVAKKADYVIVAVKPQHMQPLLAEISSALAEKPACLISIAAGLTTEKLHEYAGCTVPVVRIMPNTPAMVGAGVFAVCLEDSRLTDEQKAFITDAFSALGQVHVLPEKQFDAFTALAGSGPAYVFYFMEAVIEAGVTLGLTRAQATDMTKALFSGSCKLAEESGQHLSVLREMVCSPAGTTIAATNHLDAEAVRAAIVEAVGKAYSRSIELGK